MYKIKKLSQAEEIEFHNKFKAEMRLETLKNERLGLIEKYNHYIDNYKKDYITSAKDLSDDEAKHRKDVSMRICVNYIYLIDEVESEISKLQTSVKDSIKYFNVLKSGLIEKIIEKVVSK